MDADDTNLLKTERNLTDIFAEVNADANKLYEWFLASKLTSKTTYVIFSKSQKLKTEGLNFKIGNTEIQSKPNTNF